MPLADRSITILTGMIIAALFVILLVGFSQESYMRRDAAWRDPTWRNAASTGWASGDVAVWPVIHDVSKRVCRIEPLRCAALFADANERRSCITSIDAIRRFVSEPVIPLTLEGLRRVMRDDP